VLPAKRIIPLTSPASSTRAVDIERVLTPAQVEGLEHAWQTEPVVGVQVREEDFVEVCQADRAQELALRSLTAVDQDAVPSPADQERGQSPALRGQRAAGAREEDREFHRSASVPAGAGGRGLANSGQPSRPSQSPPASGDTLAACRL